ncbi:glycosyltransferase family 87 protein [Gordonia sinesedis]
MAAAATVAPVVAAATARSPRHRSSDADPAAGMTGPGTPESSGSPDPVNAAEPTGPQASPTGPSEAANSVAAPDRTPGLSPLPLASDPRTDTRRVIASRTDVMAGEASRIVGGPLGEHAAVGRSKYWTPLRVLFLLTLCALALGWFGKAACLQQAPSDGTAGTSAPMRLDWDDQRQFTNLCYSDVIALYSAEKLDEGLLPYQSSWVQDDGTGKQIERYMEYPVLTGMYMYGASWLSRQWAAAQDKWGVPGALDVVLFFNVVALGLALSWLVTIWATALTAGVRRWAVWVAALSPLVIVHAFTNFDAIAVAMVALAMLCWARRRPWLAGVFIGLGAAAKLYPVLLLVALFLLCLRAGKMRAFGAAAGGAVVAWLAVNLPVLLAFPRGWSEFFRLNADRGADSDSLLRLAATGVGRPWNPDVLNLASLGLMVAVTAGVAYVALRAPTRPRLAQLAFLVVAGFLLVNKVWSPQYSLWLVPLAVLALPHSRLLLAWMTVDALLWIPRMSLFLDDGRRWLPEQWFTAAVVLRALMVVGLCVVIVWQIWHPEDDLVRRDLMRRPATGWDAAGVGVRHRGVGSTARSVPDALPPGSIDDPTGGVLDGAPDRPPWGPRRTERATDRVPAAGSRASTFDDALQ